MRETIKILAKKIFGRVVFLILSVFPLEDKAVFCYFNGKQYDNNPRYISEKLHKVNPRIKQVWIQHKGYSFTVPDYIEIATWPSAKMFFELGTARIWVDSHSKPLYVWKRRGQFYMETWHGGLGMKKIEADATNVLSKDYLETSKHNIKMVDVCISNSKWFNAIYRNAFNYNGEILETGFPKNDIFFAESKSEICEKVKKRLGLSNDSKIFLYAPTFRENYDSSHWLDINLKQIHDYLNNRDDEKWVVLVRLHPKMIKEDSLFDTGESIINATMYPEMQELMVATDVYVTDYSSGVFDFAIMRRPAFIYASDYELYEKTERGLYFDIHDLPFPFAQNTEELIYSMDQFDNDEYQKNLDAFFASVQLTENGNAAYTIASYLNRIIVYDGGEK